MSTDAWIEEHWIGEAVLPRPRRAPKLPALPLPHAPTCSRGNAALAAHAQSRDSARHPGDGLSARQDGRNVVDQQARKLTQPYELAGMVYPGRAIILREHFRCVEPIISFSSRFYPKPLIPLRLPTASERLDPPLVDIYVPFGRKVRDINEAEVDVIVGEIAKIVEDPALEGRSIGV